MGGGRKRRKKIPDAVSGGWTPPVEALTKSLTGHPSGSHVVLLTGTSLIGYDFRKQEVFEIGGVSQPIRAVAFSPCGRWLFAGGDDKCFRVWEIGNWDTCVNTFKMQKKISSGAFTEDGKFCIVGDKFGDVHCGLVDPTTDRPPCSLLLGHYCSTITSISIPQGSKTIVTTDRDNKVRCSTLPPNPLEGSYDIQAYCLGHSAFVTCSSFAVWDKLEVLITGGGDGKVIIWNYDIGQMLGQYQFPKSDQRRSTGYGKEAQDQSSEEDAEPLESLEKNQKQAEYGTNLSNKGESQVESRNVIVSLSPASTSPCIALVLEGCNDVWILECDLRTFGMFPKQKLSSPQVPEPTSLFFDVHEQLWLIGGPNGLESREVHVAIARRSEDGTFRFCTDDIIPKASLDQIECRSQSTEVVETANVASISQTLGKREYIDMEGRKKLRADHKQKMILNERCVRDEAVE